MPLTAGQLRRHLETLPDDLEFDIDVAYGEVAGDHIFVRLDSVETIPTGILLTLSLVDGTETEEDQ